MLEISSNQNPLIKEIKSLNRKKNRWKSRLFIIEGIKIIQEAINNNIKIKNIIISDSFLESRDGKLFNEEIKNQDNIIKVNTSLFKSISDTENPQGLLAICEFTIRDLSELDYLFNPSILFLDGIQDPGNMGTIIRTADAFNIDGIILGEGSVDPYNSKVVRSTMGSIFRVPLYICNNSLNTLGLLKDKNYYILASSLDGNSIYNGGFNRKFVCVIGNEANGVNPDILDLAHDLIKIPMPGNAESLNAGVAASIIMYEAMKTRNIGL